MFDKKPKLTEPNEMGFQFGINESLTKYAKSEQPQWGGSALPPLDITVLEVWKDNEFKTFLFVDNKTKKELCDVYGLGAAAAKIDIYKIEKRFKENDD